MVVHNVSGEAKNVHVLSILCTSEYSVPKFVNTVIKVLQNAMNNG